MTGFFVYSAIVLSFFFGCGSEDLAYTTDEPLVQVGDKSITGGDIDRFIGNLPDNLRFESLDDSTTRRYLQSLVDRELLLMQAEKVGINEMSELHQKISDEINKILSKEISLELVDSQIAISESELRSVYDEMDLGWEVWPAHILSDTYEDAISVINELKSGRSFSEVAQERSKANDANKGGNLGGFFGEGDVVPSLREATYHLEEGEFSDPVRTKDGFEVVKLLKKRRLGFDVMRGKISKQFTRKKWTERREVVVDSLSDVRDLVYFRNRVNAVINGLFGKGINEEQVADTLVAYDGGRILVGDAIRGLRSIKKGVLPPDSIAVFTEIYRWIIPDSLFALEGRDQGRDTFPRIVKWKEKRRRSLMIGQLRLDRLRGMVEVGDKEVREYYEKYLDTYKKLPGIIEMTEVLVEQKSLAEDIYERAKQGESLNMLAKKYSIRSKLDSLGGHVFNDSGRVKIKSLFQSPYRDFFGDSNEDQVNVIQRPMLVQDYYSVFRLDKAYSKVPVPFRQVKRPIRVKIREGRESVIFEGYLDSLRHLNSNKIQWFDSNIEKYHKAQST